MTAVSLRGVTLGYAGRTVLKAVDLDIAAGLLVGVFGPNGAGKTTLLRALLGLVPTLAGQILVGGEAPARARGATGYLPQSTAAPAARLTGRDFLASGWHGARWGLPLLGPAGRQAITRALDLVEAAALARRPLRDLSGGERQRVLLAQALVGTPRLLLLDEPLLGLDPRHQAGVVALVRRLQQALGITVLFTAHELNPLLGALDRVLYLGGGGAALGTIDEVVTGPVLSRLYGAPIEVVRAGGRIFVMSGAHDLQAAGHAAHAHA